jgi:hypothetical protein
VKNNYVMKGENNMEKKIWSAPEFLELGVQSTEKSKHWSGAVDATWTDADGNYWESHS